MMGPRKFHFLTRTPWPITHGLPSTYPKPRGQNNGGGGASYDAINMSRLPEKEKDANIVKYYATIVLAHLHYFF